MPYDPHARTIRWLELIAWDATEPLARRANAVRRILQLTEDPAVPDFEGGQWKPVDAMTDLELVQLALDEQQCRIRQAELAAGWDPTP